MVQVVHQNRRPHSPAGGDSSIRDYLPSATTFYRLVGQAEIAKEERQVIFDLTLFLL